MRPRMIDVAKRAGVSQTTVSFVLNNRPDVAVAADTRERVLAAAEELGFRPNRTAQALRLNSSFTLGVITNGIASEPYAGATLLGAQQAAREAGMVCMVVETTNDPSEGDDAVASMLDRGVGGLLFAAPATGPVHASKHLKQTPTAFVNCWPDPDAKSVGVILPDEYNGGLEAARAVFTAGHRRVAFLGGRLDQWATGERRRGFEDACREVGLDPSMMPEVYGGYTTRSGYDIAMSMFDAPSLPVTAAVCGNDRMALGALLALHELGLRVPHDVSLVGYDNQEHLAADVHPGLTTVALPFYKMGYIGAQLLTGQHPIPDGRTLVRCELVVRESLATLGGVTHTEHSQPHGSVPSADRTGLVNESSTE